MRNKEIQMWIKASKNEKPLPCLKFRQNPDSALIETTIRKRQIQSWNIRSFMNQSEQQNGFPNNPNK